MLMVDAGKPGKTARGQEQRGQRASLVCKERRQLDPERCDEPKSLGFMHVQGL
jgi:hypothetical protein